MNTVLLVEITHEKPLPTKVPVTDVAAQRLYSYLYSQGCEVGVRAKLLSETERDQAHDIGVEQ